ncbi:MAG: hypothetical protein HMLKMBBP_00360 [Planctomycetes bacterium]|nr:hypothetical protein [Planctomycetota bacterium]
MTDPASRDPRAARAALLLEKIEKRWSATAEARAAAAEARGRLDAGDMSAVASFDAVLATAPFLEEALLGAAEGRLARSSEGATDDVRAALELLGDLLLRNPRSARARALRASAMLRTGDAAGALVEARLAADLDPAAHEPLLVAGQASLDLKDHDGALDLFRRSLDLRRTADACFGRALAWERQGSLGNARAEASTLCEEFEIPPRLDRDVRALLARLGLEYEPPAPPPVPPPGPGATEER